MRHHSHLVAARWAADCVSVLPEKTPARIGPVPQPATSEYVEILRQATRLYSISYESVLFAKDLMDRDLERYQSSAGRQVSIRIPVRFSAGIGDLAILIDQTIDKLEKIQETIETTAEKAAFEETTSYRERARGAINHSRRLEERTELFLYSQLWHMWAIESLTQCRQIGSEIIESDRYEGASSGVFPLLAHPPLIVTTLACTAVIEAVGGFYLNQFTRRSVDMDNTSSSEILGALEQEYDPATAFDLEGIAATILEARTDLVHYSRRRHHHLLFEDFDEFRAVVWQTIGLTQQLLSVIMTESFHSFDEAVIPDQFRVEPK